MMLVHAKTGRPMNPGDRVTTFKGEKGRLVAAYPPRHQGSTGKVIVILDGPPKSGECEFYPSVIGAKFRTEGL